MSATFARQQEEKGIFTIENVESRVITKRDGSGNFTMYDISVVEGEHPFSTTKREIAEIASELIGQPAEITYTIKVNGQWTNYYVNGILPPPLNAAEKARMAAQAQPALNQAAGFPSAPVASAPTPSAPGRVSEWEIEKSKAIHRQTAAKVAAALASVGAPASPEDFWRNTVMLAAYFDTGALPTAQGGYDSDEDIPF